MQDSSSRNWIVVALDGPAGVGKSTIAMRLAHLLGLTYVETGAIYRLVALVAGRSGVSLDDEESLAGIAASLPMSFRFEAGENHVQLGDEDVTQSLRAPEMGGAASRVSAWGRVREALLDVQRKLAQQGRGAVLEGRDIGTVVFPDADCKFFITASAEVRAHRRQNQLAEKGTQVDFATLLADIQKRDHDDSTRAVAPLKAADDATTVDTSVLTIAEVLAELVSHIRNDSETWKRLIPEGGAGSFPESLSRHVEDWPFPWSQSEEALEDDESSVALEGDELDDEPEDEDADGDDGAEPMSSASLVEGFRTGLVTIVGRPNVGKSTLLNQILGRKLAIVTPKPNTTRNRILGISTTPQAQILFLDTPGIHHARGVVNKRIVDSATSSLLEADVILWVVDCSKMEQRLGPGREELEVLRLIKEAGQPVVLALNKTDLVRKPKLLPIMQAFSQEMDFQAIVPLSALRGDGVEGLLAELLKLVPEGSPLFPSDQLTDRSRNFIMTEFIREQVFLRTSQEVPYSTAVSIDLAQDRRSKNPLLYVVASIHVERKSQKGILIGKGGAMLKAVGSAAREEIETYLKKRVFLELHVRVDEDWSRSIKGLTKVGFEE